MGDASERRPAERSKEEIVLGSLFLLERTIRSHGSAHPLVQQIASRLSQSVLDAEPPFDFQFVGAAVFRDLSLIPLSLQTYQQVQELARTFRNLDIDEVTFDAAPSLPDLIRFGGALAQGSAAPSEALDVIEIPDMSWRAIDGARWGLESEHLDPDIYTATQMGLAVVDTGRLATEPEEPWPWGPGLGVVRRLERAFRVSPTAMQRALEIQPEGWSVSRRAVSATSRVFTALDNLSANRAIRRAVAHTALALAVQGFRQRGGEPIVSAAQALLPRLVGGRGFTRTGIEPHRLRMAALVHRLFPKFAAQRKTPSILHLVLVAYELERRRCPEGTDFDLTSGDLMAHAVQESETRYDPGFVRVLLDTAGCIPIGAHVRLADGRTGVVLLTNPTEPRLPKVLVDTQVVTPTKPVTLVSPGRRTEVS